MFRLHDSESMREWWFGRVCETPQWRVGLQLKAILGVAAAVFALMIIAAFTTANRQIAKTDGTALSNGGAPSVSSCGGSPSLESGASDTAGIIDVGSGIVTSCTVTFSQAMAAAPSCVVASSLPSVTAGVSTSTAALTVALSITLGGGKIYYVCVGR